MEEFKNEKFLEFSTEVEEAKNNSPIVALESTIISHVCPTHKTLKWQKVEQIIRDNGATPATIAIMDGKIKLV